jgi:Flp pilus assembly secretin CpaC
VGEQRQVRIPKVRRYSISGDSVRLWRQPGGEVFLFKAEKPGISSLFIEETSKETSIREIRVEQKRTSPFSSGLWVAVGQLQTIEVIDGGSKLILRGLIRNLEEGRLLAQIREEFSDWVIDETRISPAWAESSAKQLRALLGNRPSLFLRREGEEFLVEGSVTNEAALSSIRKQIREIQPLTRIQIQTSRDQASTLYFKVFLLEVKKDLMNQLGVSWPESQPASLRFSPFALHGTNSLDLSIHALSEKGIARLLSSPELVVKAPGQAELFSGGELPIRQKTHFNESVTWKNFGLTLKIDVKEFFGTRVRLSVETEISQIDSSLKTDQIPGLKSNRLKTLVDSELDQPLLLSGLLQEDLQDRRSGLFGLGSIPILGALFSSEDYQNKRSELVAILLPHGRPPESPQSRIQSGIPRGFLPLPRDHLSIEERETLRNSKDYPWNTL